MKNHSISRLSGRWRNITKECYVCKFKSKDGDKTTCNFGGIKSYIFTKINKIYSKCTLKHSKQIKVIICQNIL